MNVLSSSVRARRDSAVTKGPWARPWKRAIQRLVEDELAKLGRGFKSGYTIPVNRNADGLIFTKLTYNGRKQ